MKVESLNSISTTTSESVQDYHRALLHSVSHGDVECVQTRLADNKTNVDGMVNGRTALSHNVEHGNAEVAQLLIDRGAYVTKMDLIARSPLSYAVEAGQGEIVQLMVDLGADATENDLVNRSLLMYATIAGNTEIARILVDLGVDVTEKDKYGRSPLSYAVYAGNTETVQLLIDQGADVTERDVDGRSPLSYAARAGQGKIVQLLVDRGADVTEKDEYRRSPMSYVTKSGNTEIVQLLLDLGADVTERDRNGRSPVWQAAEVGNTEIVRILVDRGADVTEKDKYGRSPMSYVAESGNTEIVQLLIDLGADVTERDENGRSPLSYAAKAGQGKIVRILVDRGADVTVKDEYRRCSLSYAAESGNTEIVQLLIDLGADVTERDENGRSPLSYAAESGYSSVIIILIKDGSAVDDQDSNGKTALPYAAQHGHGEVVSFLLKAGASPNGTIVWNESQPECETSLTLAGRAGHMNIVKTLVEAGADVDVRAADGETPLVSISRWDYAPGVQLLIEKCRSGVNPFATRSTARTPLLRGTLKTMHELCTKTHEFAVMTTRVMQRLQDVCSQLEQQGMIGVQSEALTTLIPILFRFCRLLFRCKEQKRLLSRLISSLAISSAIKSDWKDQWLTDERNTMQSIYEKLVDDGALVDGLDNTYDKDRAAVLLVNTLRKQRGTNQEAVDAIEDVKNRFLRVCGMEEPSVPDWFISREDVEFNEWNRTEGDAEITTYEGKWLKTKVIVATSQWMDKNEFQKVADRWYSLSHPNVRKLFGACHIESKPFFVYEYGKQLLDVLTEKQQSPWKYLYDAALGVQLLHQRNIVHGDLRCSNIVVGLDGVAKVGGLEAHRREELYFRYETERADWASPELLLIHVKSLSSDIYAFGMCILEAITLKRPWFPLKYSRYSENVRCGELPDRPESFSDDQRDLVTKMCAFRTADRISIGCANVVLAFAKHSILLFQRNWTRRVWKSVKGVWLDTPVVVKFMGYEGDRDTISNELFLHEVRVWHQLKKHPHIIALGLAYMHGLNVVHNDLKCDNVLVGMDGKAKLIDFGLSAIVGDSEIMVDMKNMGAVHWKSPEYLAGERPSFASDVYSFAMCILEAVTGDIPWGSNMLRGVVKFRVKRGNLPTRPGMMNDKQWNLIELMTKLNPSERVRMTFVVDKLFEISEEEKSRAAAGPGVQGAQTKMRALTRLLLLCLWTLAPSPTAAAKEAAAPCAASDVLWVWKGALSSHSVTFKFGLREGHSCRDRDFILHVYPQLEADERPHSSIAMCHATGAPTVKICEVAEALHADRKYTYALSLIASDEVVKHGAFRTPQDEGSAFNFRLAFSSCADEDSDPKVFDEIASHDPLLFLHMGDLHYHNLEVNDVAVFRSAYSELFASPSGRAMLAMDLPFAYMWDDHDYGPDNSDKMARGRNAAVQAYREFVPHYELPGDKNEGPLSAVYQAFTIGRVRFILTDLRSERTPNLSPDVPSKTVLGAKQKKWFKEELVRATEDPKIALILWCSTMPWIDDERKWGYFTHEQQELVNYMKGHNLNKWVPIIIVSGDAHMLAVDDGSNSPGNLTTLHAAALGRPGSIKGGPYSHGLFPGTGQYGLLDIQDDGKRVCVYYRGMNIVGGQLLEYDTCHPERTPPQAPYYPPPIPIRVMQRAWKKIKRELLKRSYEIAGVGALVAVLGLGVRNLLKKRSAARGAKKYD
ncbi:Mitogen-activated protein kinase kinase, partial [Globisporangium splendens]